MSDTSDWLTWAATLAASAAVIFMVSLWWTHKVLVPLLYGRRGDSLGRTMSRAMPSYVETCLKGFVGDEWWQWSPLDASKFEIKTTDRS